jgi:hypothetical protein
MSHLFSHNAYCVLGLDTGASQKEISRWSKEIQHKLWADESPECETDIDTLNKIVRDESSVNDAVQRLSSPVKRIPEYFFWFEIENDADENNLSLLRDNQYDEALDDWKGRAEKSLTAKRNLAIASSLLLNHTGYKKYLKLSITAWKDVVNSDKFWQHFEKVYLLNDEVGTSKVALDNFRNSVANYLSDFYSEVSQDEKDNSIYAAFSTAFNVKGQKVQDEVLAPIFEQVNNASKQLQDLKVSKDNIISSDEANAIKRLVRLLQNSFQEIKDLGLYEDSQVKRMRDKAAEAISIVSVDLYNNLGEITKSAVLDKIALSLASGPAVISRIKKDIAITQQSLVGEKVVKPINALIEKEEFEKAIELILESQQAHADNKDLQGFLATRLKWCITGIAVSQFNEGQKLYNDEKYNEAKELLVANVEFILSYLEDTDISRNYVENILTEINKLTDAIGTEQDAAQSLDVLRNNVINQSEKQFKDKFEKNILITIADSAIYANFAEKLPAIKNRSVKNAPPLFTLNGVGTKIYGETLYFVFLFIPILPLASYNLKVNGDGSYIFYSKKPLKTWQSWWKWILIVIAIFIAITLMSGSSSSSSTDSTSTSPNTPTPSAWQMCSNEYDSLKSQLDSTNSTMDSYESAGNTDAFNNLVPQQNSLVQQLNSKATECNNLR